MLHVWGMCYHNECNYRYWGNIKHCGARVSKQCTVTLNCYVARLYQWSIRSQLTGHSWHIAKTRFVTLLSTKMLNSLEKIVMLAEKNLSWCSTAQWSHFFYHYAATLGVIYTQAKSEHSQACIVLTWGILGNSKRSHHAPAWNRISAAFYTFGKLSLSTQLDVYSPSPVNHPVSKCYTSAA